MPFMRASATLLILATALAASGVDPAPVPGTHLLEVTPGAAPELRFRGVIGTAEADQPGAYPRHVAPDRSVIHADNVFVVSGDDVTAARWTSF